MERELDPVGSTVRYEMMKLCTGSVQDTMRRLQLVIDDTGSVEDSPLFDGSFQFNSFDHESLVKKLTLVI